MSAAPAVSVLMPVYNAERHLAEAVESILGQTFRDFEFVIIDDGSKDGSLRILRDHESRDPRIRLRSRPNGGYVTALNEMLGLATGRLLARMDADDVARPERFERQVKFMDDHPEVVAVGSRVMLIDPDGCPIKPMNSHTDHESIDAEHMRARGGTIAHPSVMIRTDAMRQVGGYRKEFEPAEDIDLFLRLAEIGRLANLSDALLDYRLHGASVGHQRSQEQQQNCRRAVAAARARRQLPGGGADTTTEVKPDPESHFERWAWWALNGGNKGTARKHATNALLRRPLSASCWRLMYCAWLNR